MSKSWDSGILKKLKALVGKGLSTAEIGKRLGMSKNAIVGKLHRLGWNAKNEVAPAKKAVAAKKTAVAPTKKTAVKKVAGTAKKVASGKKVATKAAAPVKTKTVKGTKAKSGTKAIEKKVTAPVKKDSGKKDVASGVKEKPVKKVSEGKNLAVHQRIVQHSLEMAALKPGQCRWPIGDPDSENFHFCGQPVFVGKPYCYEHCRQAYQFAAPKKK